MLSFSFKQQSSNLNSSTTLFESTLSSCLLSEAQTSNKLPNVIPPLYHPSHTPARPQTIRNPPRTMTRSHNNSLLALCAQISDNRYTGCSPRNVSISSHLQEIVLWLKGGPQITHPFLATGLQQTPSLTTSKSSPKRLCAVFFSISILLGSITRSCATFGSGYVDELRPAR